MAAVVLSDDSGVEAGTSKGRDSKEEVGTPDDLSQEVITEVPDPQI